MGDIIGAIRSAANEHLPDHAERNAVFAVLLALKILHDGGYHKTVITDDQGQQLTVGNFKVRISAELALIDQLERACKAAQDLFRKAHDETKSAMYVDTRNRHDDLSFHRPVLRELLKRFEKPPHEYPSWPAPSPPEALRQLSALHDALAPAFAAARAWIREGEEAGKLDWRRLAAVEAVRSHWNACTNRPAPKSATENPFGSFARAIFDAAGLGSAEGAFAAWVQSNKDAGDDKPQKPKVGRPRNPNVKGDLGRN